MKNKGDMIDFTSSDYQGEVFGEIVNMTHKMQSLAGFVSNDFNRMLADGTITKGNIRESIYEMDEAFNRVIGELNTLREKCGLIMTHHCV